MLGTGWSPAPPVRSLSAWLAYLGTHGTRDDRRRRLVPLATIGSPEEVSGLYEVADDRTRHFFRERYEGERI